MSLVNEIAELLYSEEVTPVPWERALAEDRVYFHKLADVVVDAVVEHLIIKDQDFAGGLSAAIQYLQNDADMDRLRRGADSAQR
jgi:hypothetical protein